MGAGPGDPGLITVKGLELTKQADVIILDHLVNKKFLVHAKSDAEIIYVGKEAGKHTIPQDKINKILIREAKKGKMVVRLKGGDPFVFGRGGEEALELVKNGIPFEVVPGVSSAYAVPTYAGIPVTQRGIASTMTIATGHEDPAKLVSDIDWDKLAISTGTLVFLMAIRNLPTITGELIKHGRDPKTPVALIRWGTLPKQKTLIGTLENIVQKAEKAAFRPPGIVVVGEAVALRNKLNWFETKPLFGKRIVVTRSKEQAGDLTRALEELGAEVIELPTIKIVPPDSYRSLDQAIDRIVMPNSAVPAGRQERRTANYYDWVIFTSANGVSYFMDRLRSRGQDGRVLKGVKLAAIGPATARKLEEFGLKIDLVPKDYRAESLIEGLKKEKMAGVRILIPRAKEAREVLPESLKSLGAEVDVATAYQTVIDDSKVARFKEILLGKKVDVITFTSSSTVKNFVKLLRGVDSSHVLSGVKIACIGPITAQTARDEGLKVDLVAKEYTIPGLVEALTRRK